MAQDYSTLVDLFGPGTGAMMAGEQYQMAQDASLLKQRQDLQAIREAQLKNAQSEAMNPLLVSHQQLTNAGQTDTNRKTAVDAIVAEQTQGNKIATSNLDLAEKQRKEKMDKMQQMASTLNYYAPQVAAGGPQAAAIARQALIEGGANPDHPGDARQIAALLGDANKSPQQMANDMMKLQKHIITTSADYIKAMDDQKLKNQGSADVARIGAASRETVAASRGNKGAQTIADQVRSGKMTAEKAAVALFGAAQFEEDPTRQQQLLDMAKQYETFAMNQRNASAGGKLDVGAATGLPTQTLPPALGGGPKLGTAENPIKLK